MDVQIQICVCIQGDVGWVEKMEKGQRVSGREVERVGRGGEKASLVERKGRWVRRKGKEVK
jgi:hypothetical protein